MRSRVTFIAVLAVIVGVTAAAPLGATTHDVSITGASFNPPNLTIQQGDIVRWTNNSILNHTTTSGTSCVSDGTWSAPLAPSAQFSFTFNTAGDFPYFCIPHCLIGMTGFIKVEAPATDCILNCPQVDGGVINTTNGPSNKSPDLDSDGVVGLVDLSLFAQAFPPNAYQSCADFDCDGVIGLVDLSNFALHYLHQGPQNGICQ